MLKAKRARDSELDPEAIRRWWRGVGGDEGDGEEVSCLCGTWDDFVLAENKIYAIENGGNSRPFIVFLGCEGL